MSSVAPSLPTAITVPNEIEFKTPAWKSSPFCDVFKPHTTKLRRRYHGPRARPALWDIGDGCILWLPKNYTPPPSQDNPLRNPPKGALDHPILVLDVDVSGPENAIISFATMRSFKACANGPDHSRPDFWWWFMQISPTPRGEPNSTETPTYSTPSSSPLFLERYRPGRHNMKAESYISTGAVYSARWEDLRCYAWGITDGTRFRLDEESYARVRARMQVCAGLKTKQTAWVPTSLLWGDFATRFIGATDKLGVQTGGDGKVAQNAKRPGRRKCSETIMAQWLQQFTPSI